MASIGDLIDSLEQVLATARAVLGHLTEADAAWRETSGLMEICLSDSNQPDVREFFGLAATAERRFEETGTSLTAGIRTLEKYLAHLCGESSASTVAPSSSPRAGDGSRYPPGAAWCIDDLPRRVREGRPGEKTVGYVDGSLTPFTSGRDGTWTPAIERRLAELRIVSRRTANFVSSHVEMKVATMMITQSRRRCEVVINHSPCGSQPNQLPGCDQVLGPYLPKGYTLVVHGTTQQGDPFSRTYEGRA